MQDAISEDDLGRKTKDKFTSIEPSPLRGKTQQNPDSLVVSSVEQTDVMLIAVEQVLAPRS